MASRQHRNSNWYLVVYGIMVNSGEQAAAFEQKQGRNKKAGLALKIMFVYEEQHLGEHMYVHLAFQIHQAMVMIMACLIGVKKIVHRECAVNAKMWGSLIQLATLTHI
ncbi:hypothetical protein QVD17_09214 [Tagetes erecta]|uniref:Uncharacterized protein n=1 Tax=Tagetes erecta TaxID=13708 RepID=A0AAD8P4V9_TARER|nr:hypothetical protein QVD17_09214 [Tagetes erecta]